MRQLNQKGSVVLFFMMVLPVLLLFLIATLDFSLQVFTKIKLQAALDQATFVGGQVLTSKLNKIAEKNGEVHKAFTDLKKHFSQSSRDTLAEAQNYVKSIKKKQESLYEEMQELEANAYQEALAKADAVFHKTFPHVSLIPVYQSPFGIDVGTFQEFGFDEIDGVLWDPTKYKKNVEIFTVREAFNKNPRAQVALALAAEVFKSPTISKYFRLKPPLRAVSAAQPYGGSIWHYATEKENKARLYRTAFVPITTLPEEGFTDGGEYNAVYH